MSRKSLNVFISYAHEDDFLRAELQQHLSLLVREGQIRTWHDREIAAGDDWRGQIDEHLEEADLILLLVSAAFLASDYCFDVETTRALERHAQGEAWVMPVIVRPCDWTSAPFSKLQALPNGGKPVTRWPDHDEAWLDVAQGLRAVISSLPDKSAERRQQHHRSHQRWPSGPPDRLQDLPRAVTPNERPADGKLSPPLRAASNGKVNRRLPPLAWIAAGCGIIMTTGIILFMALTSSTFKKVKELGEGATGSNVLSELVEDMKENPTKTVAETVIRANPELELVGSDDEAGTITFINTKTGEEATLNFEDIAEGRFSMSTDEGEYRIDATDSGEGGVTFTGPEGEARFGASADLSDVPGWVPAYPGATDVESTMHASSAAGIMGAFTGKSTDDAQQVLDHFKQLFEDGGYKIGAESITHTGDGAFGAINGDLGESRSINVVIIESNGESQVTINYNQKKPDWVPVYPGATDGTSTMHTASADGVMGAFTAKSTDNAQKIVNYFKQLLTDRGYEIGAESMTHTGDGAFGAISGDLEDGRSINVVIIESNGESQVTINYNQKQQ